MTETAHFGTWGISPEVRRVLRNRILGLREAVEQDFGRQLRAIGINERGVFAPPAGRTLTDGVAPVRGVAATLIEREVAGGASTSEAFETYVRESGFTFLNRMLGFRCLEERGLLVVDGLKETLVKIDSTRNTSSLYWRVRNESSPSTPPREVWRETVRRACTGISDQVGVLFEPESEFAALFPLQPTIQMTIDVLNDSVIPSETYGQDEILGWVYQYYNAREKDEAYAKLAKGKKLEQPEELIAATCLYTERYMVDYLLQNTLGALWVEMHPESKLPERWPYFVQPPDGEPVHPRNLRPLRDITLLDPACGSGHFLVRAFELLVEMYREEGRESEGEIAQLIIERNLHGIDIDLRAVQIAALALYLKGCSLAGAGFRPRCLNLVAADALITGEEPAAEYLATLQGDPQATAAVKAIWSGLRNVRQFGSLLHPERALDEVIERQRSADPLHLRDDAYWEQWKAELLTGLAEEFERQSQSEDLGQRFFGKEAAKSIGLVETLGHQYDVVVANPPYVGGRNLNPQLRTFLESAYPEGKRDVYAAFIERSRQFCSSDSYLGLVTQQGWMFLEGFSKLRRSFLQDLQITTLCHLGPKTFPDLSNSNALGFCMFVALNRSPRPGATGVFFRLVRNTNKERGLIVALADYRSKAEARSSFFVTSQDSFPAITGSPLAYWAPSTVLTLFEQGASIGKAADAKQGLITGDNERFLRFFWEVSPSLTSWVPYMKGGPYRRWYGNTELVVDWTGGGQSIRTLIDDKGKLRSRPQNVRFYGLTGATWTAQSSYGLSMRWMPKGYFFDAKGPGLFVKDDHDLFGLIAIFNTPLLQFLFGLVQPTIDFHEGYLLSLPFPTDYRSQGIWAELCELGVQAVSLKRELAVQLITEREFQTAHLETAGVDLETVGRAKVAKEIETLAAIHWIEGVVSDLTVELYGLTYEEREFLDTEEGTPAGWLPLLEGHEALPAQIPPNLRKFERRAARVQTASSDELLALSDTLARQLESEAQQKDIGGSNGDSASDLREVLDFSLGEDEPPTSPIVNANFPVETWLEAVSRSIGISPVSLHHLFGRLEQSGRVSTILPLKPWFEDYATVSTLRSLGYRWPSQDGYEQEHGPILDPSLVDDDGIIPLVPVGDHQTALDLMRARLESDFGPEGAENSEQKFRQWAGRDLAEWLRRDFFRRHVQQFRQRPIAWHLVSPERTFEAFVLYHKLSRSTLQDLRVKYAGTLVGELRAEQARARERSDAAAVTRLQGQIEDVEEFRATLEKIERGDELKYRIRCPWKDEEADGRPGPYAPDIDDGVKVNIRPFQEAGLLAMKDVIKKW